MSELIDPHLINIEQADNIITIKTSEKDTYDIVYDDVDDEWMVSDNDDGDYEYFETKTLAFMHVLVNELGVLDLTTIINADLPTDIGRATNVE